MTAIFNDITSAGDYQAPAFGARMTVIDLTQAIAEGMPVYPGTEGPRLAPASSYERDGFKETRLTMYSHTGTHIDPPAHIFPGGTTLDRLPASQFIGTALVIDCRDVPAGGEIGMERLEPYGKALRQAGFLLFNTGWDRFWGREEYFYGYPCVSAGVLDFVLAGDYRGIGLDTIGLDPVDDAHLTRHRRLFSGRDIINIENLTGLGRCPEGIIGFGCFPIKLTESDGAPARALAWS